MKKFLKKNKPVYKDALNKSKNDKNDNKQRKRKIIWYNPPYSANIKTIGKTFLNLTKKLFLKTNKLHKTFNKNTVKISYSCMNNISIISRHNKTLLNLNDTQYGCNC